MSEPACVGYDGTMAQIVCNVCKESEKEKRSVNVIGLPVLTEGWQATKEELSSYLSAMGLKVNAFVGAGCTVDELETSFRSECNVTVIPEYCRLVSEEFSRIGVPTLVLPVPFGYSGTKKWIESIAERFEVDPGPAITILDRRNGRITDLMMQAGRGSCPTRGMTYSVSLDSELVLPLVKWLYSYLGMFPRCIRVCRWWRSETVSELESFLSGIGCKDAINEELTDERCRILFSDGITSDIYVKKGVCQCGVDLQQPTSRMYGFVRRPVLGIGGMERILDDIFNGLFSPHY